MAPTVAAAFSDTTIKITAPVINVSATAEDDGMPYPGELAYTWEVIEGEAASVSIASADQKNTDVTFSATGNYKLQITVDDGEMKAMDEISVGVESPDNTAPVVSVTFSDTTITEGVTIRMLASASDDGYPDPPSSMTYAWTVSSGVADNVTIASADQLNTDITISTDGSYVLQLSVSDGELAAYKTVAVTVEKSTIGIEPALQPVVKIYPNPAMDMLILELVNQADAGMTVKVFDLTGKALINGKSENSRMILDINHLAPGVYFVSVKSGEFSSLHKISKQRR
jgi:hypothetical protein